ncbi:hypothetical protein B0O80DRAFT_186819 [Mortierella sp. GBAus27b]|nr:hypothetical protein B0O80DRAFT_186819 [Mortierella sp. GBAus27b]
MTRASSMPQQDPSQCSKCVVGHEAFHSSTDPVLPRSIRLIQPSLAMRFSRLSRPRSPLQCTSPLGAPVPCHTCRLAPTSSPTDAIASRLPLTKPTTLPDSGQSPRTTSPFGGHPPPSMAQCVPITSSP